MSGCVVEGSECFCLCVCVLLEGEEVILWRKMAANGNQGHAASFSHHA